MARGGTSVWAARTLHAAVESLAYLFSTSGFRVFLVVNSVAVAVALGPGKASAVALRSAACVASVRFVMTLRHSITEGGEEGDELTSLWQFEPPADTALAGTGAWTVLRELAVTTARAPEVFPSLRDLDMMPAHELAVRLCFLYNERLQDPIVDTDFEGPRDASSIDGGALARYLYLADQAYEGDTEPKLASRLKRMGYQLVFCKLEATWAEHCPAYYVALRLGAGEGAGEVAGKEKAQERRGEERDGEEPSDDQTSLPRGREAAVVVRGTAQLEDAITDLTALPEEYEGHLVHGGVFKSARWLLSRIGTLCQALEEGGFAVTLVGHSLGAAVAAVLAIMLRKQCAPQ